MALSARAAAGNWNSSPTSGARPQGRKPARSPAATQLRRGRGPLLLHHRRQQVAALGDLDGGRQQVGERQLAEALDSATQPRTAPGTVTESMPRLGGVVASAPYFALKYSGVQALPAPGPRR
jgi:hypothetical protein